ncbi:whey acidic protein-like isoform X2 [Nannospalax galili]|uniref:whey acidic protein-like isoform X2 n=1 Tax=Nannospalax galili TaxID=1026970 RepID=UPI0004ED2BF5|nr:whey acidic protein-like isoform X2 [Nannospalax galili]
MPKNRTPTQDIRRLAQFMCPEVSSEEERSCINQCSTSAECGLDTVCCPSICGGSCKTPIRIGIPKAGQCPWNPLHMIPAKPCPEQSECSSDSDCEGIMKCCNIKCAMKCLIPEAEESFY